MQNEMKKDQELSGIELLRFLCAFGVVVWHYQQFFFKGEWDPVTSEAMRPTFPCYSALKIFYENGSLAVPFFWVISGFIFNWHYARSIENRSVGMTEYILRRFSRLYPLHLATLLAVVVGQHYYFASHNSYFIYVWSKPIWFAAQLLFASNWFAREPLSFNGPIWSVSIEVLIYLVFFAATRILRPGLRISVVISLIFALLYYYSRTFLNPLVFSCGMYFFAGSVANQAMKFRPIFPLASALAVALLLGLTLGAVPINDASMLVLAMCVVITSAGASNTALRPGLRRVAFLGNATYSSYLLHFPLQLAMVLVVDFLGISRDIFYNPLALLLYLSLVIALSLLAHKFFEMPAQKLIRDRAGRHTRI